MAAHDKSLKKVILAYSAFHLSALNGSQVPERRVCIYIKEIAYDLRVTLSGQRSAVPVSKIAIILMMASMDYTFFSPSISSLLSTSSGQIHLDAAKALLKALLPSKASMSDTTLGFLIKWYCLMELAKKSSGGKADRPLIFDIFGDSEEKWNASDLSDDMHAQIECIWGCTLGCLLRLTKVAELATEACEQ